METVNNDQQEENRQIIKTEIEGKRPPPVAKKPKPPIAKKPPIAQKPSHLVRSPSSLDDKENSVSTSPRVPPPLPKTPPKGPGGISNHISPSSTPPTKQTSLTENCVDNSNVKTTPTLQQKTPPVPPKKSISKESKLSGIHSNHVVSSQSKESFNTASSNGSVPQQPPTPQKRVHKSNQVTDNAEVKGEISHNSVQKVEKTENELVNGDIQNELNSKQVEVNVEEKHVRDPDLNCSGEGHTNEESSETQDYKGPPRFNPFDKQTSVEGQSENDCENTASYENTASCEITASCEKNLTKLQHHNESSSSGPNSVSENSLSNDQIQDKHLWSKKDKLRNSGKKLQNSAEHSSENNSQTENSSLSVMSKIQMFLHKNGDIPSNRKSISKSHENVSSTGNTDNKHKHKDWTSFFKNRLSRHEEVKSEQTFISYIDENNENGDSCSDSTVTSNISHPSCNINVTDDDEDKQSVSSYGSCPDKSHQLNNELNDIFQRNSSFHNNISDSEDYRRNSLPNYTTRRESCSPVNQSKSVPNKPQPVPRKKSPNRPRPIPRKRLSLSRQGSQSSISEIPTTDSEMSLTVKPLKENESGPSSENSNTGDMEKSKSCDSIIETGIKTDEIKDCNGQVLNVNENRISSSNCDVTLKLVTDNSLSQDLTTDSRSDRDYVHLSENTSQNINSDLTPNKDFVQPTESKNQDSTSKPTAVLISKVTNIQKNSETEKLKFSCGENKDMNSNFIKYENSCTSQLENKSEIGKLQMPAKEKVQRDVCQKDISIFEKQKAKSVQCSESNSLTLKDVPKAQSFDASILSGEPLMETSSLLDEIEQLVSRRLSKLGPEFACEFSKSSDPVPPPRPKRDDRRKSQVSCTGFDVDSDELDRHIFKGSNTSLDSNIDHHGIPPAVSKKQCPPKPKRTKLINRSHSDVSGMKQLSLFKQEDTDISIQTSDISHNEDSVQNGDSSNPLPLPPRRLRSLTVDFCVPANQAALIKQIEINDSKNKSETGSGNNVDIVKSDRIKKLRPTRRAPPPPVQGGAKSQNMKNNNNGHHSFRGEGIHKYYSVDHDYHEIPDNIGQKSSENHGSNLSLNNESAQHKEKSPSPPDLPPRNYNQSPPRHSFLDNRPLSMASLISSSSNSGSLGSPEQDELTSSDSDGEDDEDKLKKKKEKKVFFIANEIVSSEKVFVDVLKLLNQDFRLHISQTTESLQRTVISNDILNKILNYLPQLQNFNEDLLHDLEERMSHWEEHKKVADIFVKKGPFLKLYTSYIKDFEDMTLTLDEACKKNPAFHSAVKSFETSPRCANLGLKHYMLKPIQRIPQYKLLLKDYRKHLSPSSPDYEDTNSALNIVSEVADHANESMRHGDQVHKLLEIQRSLDGNFEVIKPGRLLMKQGELMKLSRKEMQPRFFFLFNDVLLYTTPMATGGYRLNNALTLAGMKATKANLDEFKNEFNIISVQRSFTVEARTPEERDEWLEALNSAIDETAQRRGTFESVKAGMQTSFLDKDFVLGSKAPIWVPDTRVTMCMNCTGEFTVTWRRHHCRACGRVVCANCSDNRAPLEYLRNKPARVCDDCFEKLHEDFEKKAGDSSIEVVPESMDQDGSLLSFGSLKERFQKIRRSARLGHKFSVHRPSRLREVHASDQGSSMSGNLKMLKGRKWKKFWFVIKDKVLYTYKASADMAAIESMPILGYEVVRFTEAFEGVAPALLFQLNHKNRPPVIFQTDTTNSTDRWVKAMKDASVA